MEKSKKSLVKILGLCGIVSAASIASIKIGYYLNTPIYVAGVDINGDNKTDLKIYTRRGEVFSLIQNQNGSFRFLLHGEEEILELRKREKYKSKQNRPFFYLISSRLIK